MAKQTRDCYIVGNWKMYKTIDEAIAFVDKIAPLAKESTCKIMLAVPFTAIKPLSEKVKGTNIVIGAQNMNDASEGAFTGEVAAVMLKDAGAEFVLLGHSERRVHFKEDNNFINRKVIRAVESGLIPLLCIGESYDEREANKTDEVLQKQLEECLQGLDQEAAKSLMIAYEPVWAIGTGLAATEKDASQAIKKVKTVLGELLGDKNVSKVPMLYGGSVSPNNAQSFLESSDIDGLLIGSASLAADSFAQIISLQAK